MSKQAKAVSVERRAFLRHAWRIREVIRGALETPPPARSSTTTFLVPHHDSAEFLEVCLHAIRRFHPDSRIIVVDAASERGEYFGAKQACRRYDAEHHAGLFRRGHTAQLNRLLCLAKSEVSVFLDQDCVLLAPLTPLVDMLRQGKLLTGPEDLMRLTHPGFLEAYPGSTEGYLRLGRGFIHASLMVVDPRRIRQLFGRRPFNWRKEWTGKHIEKYYGLCRRLELTRPGLIEPLKSQHTGYGMGMVYLHNSVPLAYHNWYSGRISKLHGKVDTVLDVDWLRAEMKRFLGDYWSGTLDFQLPKELPARKQD